MSTMKNHTLHIMRQLFNDLHDHHSYYEEGDTTLLHLRAPEKTELVLYQDRQQSLASFSVVLWDETAMPMLAPCIKFYTASGEWIPLEVETPIGFEQYATFEHIDRVKTINHAAHGPLATYLEALAFRWRTEWLSEPPQDWLKQVGSNTLDLHELTAKRSQILHGDIPF